MLPALRELDVDFSVAHLGLYGANVNTDYKIFAQLLELAAAPGSHCWLKLTGFYRISKEPDYRDVGPLVRELLDAAPGRALWGSDYPHVSHYDTADSVQLLNLFMAWAGTDELRRQVLVDNPAGLFGTQGGQVMGIEGRRVALLVEDEFNLDEFIYPFHRFREAGAELKVVGSSRAASIAQPGHGESPRT